jgi:quercetin dioxygenase-like cupin family protein
LRLGAISFDLCNQLLLEKPQACNNLLSHCLRALFFSQTEVAANRNNRACLLKAKQIIRRINLNTRKIAMLVTLFLCSFAGAEENTPPTMPGLTSVALMTAQVAPEKAISRAEIEEITFEPMRKAALHLHPIPVLSFIKEGSIAFQVEGQSVQHLKAGDVCYEPANARISRFDNEGDTPAKFVALYMLGKDDHEHIQRLSQSASPGGPAPARKNLMTGLVSPEKNVSRVEIRALTLVPKRQGPLHLHPIPVFTVIEEGSVTFQIEGQPAQRLKAGDVFYEPANVRIARLDNEEETPAKLVVFFLLGKDDRELVQRL